MFYVYALLNKALGIKLMTLFKYLPPLTNALTIFPFYFLSKKLVGGNKALFATFVFSMIPASFSILNGPAMPRSAGLIFLIITAIFAYTSFKTSTETRDQRKYAIVAGLFFGLTILTNPISAFDCFLTLLVFFLILSYPTYKGNLSYFACILSVGVFLSLPWWLSVLTTHGIDPFLNAVLNRLGEESWLSKIAFFNPSGENLLTLWSALGLLGALSALLRRNRNDVLLVVWLASLSFIIGRPFNAAVPFTILVSAGFFHLILPFLRGQCKSVDEYRAFISLTLLVLLGFGIINALSPIVGGDNNVQSRVNRDDIKAAQWIKSNTPTNSTLLILDHLDIWSLNTWVPTLSERNSLNCIGNMWGLDTNEYKKRRKFVNSLSHFDNLKELFTTLDRYNFTYPDYIYASTECRNQKLMNSINRTFEPVFREETVAIYKVNISKKAE